MKQNQAFSLFTAKDKKQAEKIISFFGNGARFKKELIEKFTDKGITSYTFYMNTIPAAAADKLLAAAKPEYREIYNNINKYFYDL